MRLTAEQQGIIREIVHSHAGASADIVLFGSRLDDARHGGDVDLLIESDRPLGLLDRARIKLRLEAHLGLPVDVLTVKRGEPLSPFQRIARETGVVIPGGEVVVPEISRFLGIIIAMHYNDHAPPHFHAKYGEHEALIAIATGEVIEGRLPPRALGLVQEWRELHTTELAEVWCLARERRALKRITPLE
jgi:predicted nucleotidyltransferase